MTCKSLKKADLPTEILEPEWLRYFLYSLLVSIYFVIPPNSNAYFDWTRLCHVPRRAKLANYLGKGQLEISTRT